MTEKTRQLPEGCAVACHFRGKTTLIDHATDCRKDEIAGRKRKIRGIDSPTWCAECLEPVCGLLPKSQMPNSGKWCAVVGFASNGHRAVRCRRQSKPHKDHRGRYAETLEWST